MQVTTHRTSYSLYPSDGVHSHEPRGATPSSRLRIWPPCIIHQPRSSRQRTKQRRAQQHMWQHTMYCTAPSPVCPCPTERCWPRLRLQAALYCAKSDRVLLRSSSLACACSDVRPRLAPLTHITPTQSSEDERTTEEGARVHNAPVAPLFGADALSPPSHALKTGYEMKRRGRGEEDCSRPRRGL